ncbi:MAG: Ppx/GppA phosphatase family protein [Rhizobiaceae bacterium]
MKRSTDGSDEPKEEPIRELRDNDHASGDSRQPAQRSPHESGSPSRNVGKGKKPRNSGNGNGSERPDRSNFRGRAGAAASASSEAVGRGQNEHSGRRNSKSKNSRNGGPEHGVLRNMRAPARRTPDVTFDPGSRANEGSKKNNNGSKSEVLQRNPQCRKNDSRNSGKNFDKNYGRNSGNDGRQRLLYAALDLGTNNCRLLIVAPQEVGRFRVVDAFSRIVRLGEGLSHSGRLSDAAMQRSIDALKICAAKLRHHGVKRFRLIATEACRQAKNGVEFLLRVKNETGLDLEIVNRETEARLAAEGCGTLMDRKADAAVLFDIGGGSSELILIDRNLNMGKGARSHKKPISERITAWTSLPLGVVTLAERHGGKEVSRSVFDLMVEEVVGHLKVFEGRDKLAHIWNKGRVHLLGTSGTVTTIAGIHLKLPKYDRRKVDGIWLMDREVDAVISQLLSMGYDERARNPCIGHERADLVLAGCAILQAIRLTWPCQKLRVADRGLREGLLNEMINGDGAWITPKKGRWRKKRHRRPSGNSNFRPGNPRQGET